MSTKTTYFVIEHNYGEFIRTPGLPKFASLERAASACSKRIHETYGGPIFVVDEDVANFLILHETDLVGFETYTPKGVQWHGAKHDHDEVEAEVKAKIWNGDTWVYLHN